MALVLGMDRAAEAVGVPDRIPSDVGLRTPPGDDLRPLARLLAARARRLPATAPGGRRRMPAQRRRSRLLPPDARCGLRAALAGVHRRHELPAQRGRDGLVLPRGPAPGPR